MQLSGGVCSSESEILRWRNQGGRREEEEEVDQGPGARTYSTSRREYTVRGCVASDIVNLCARL